MSTTIALPKPTIALPLVLLLAGLLVLAAAETFRIDREVSPSYLTTTSAMS